MFAQDQKGETVLGESRRLKTLAAVLASERATLELRERNNLDQAYLFSDGPNEALNNMLATADSTITNCLQMLSSDVEVDQGHAQIAERILNNAENLQFLVQKAIRRTRTRSAENETQG